MGRAIVAVAAGAGHSVAVSARGELWCWGVAAKGQCGVQSVQQVLHNRATITVPLVDYVQILNLITNPNHTHIIIT